MKKYQPISLENVKTYSIKTRSNKVKVEDHFAVPASMGGTVSAFMDSLPKLLAADDLRYVIDAIVKAVDAGRPVIAAIGGHVIKCGLQPVLKQLIENGVISAVAMNGSAAIHDYEVSLIGETSEDVGAVLQSGDFGFSSETGQGMNRALKNGKKLGLGFGESIARAITENAHPYLEASLLATCTAHDIPATVHVALGTDIIHQHPEADGATIGELSYQDFKLLTSVVCDLGDGGVWLNIGSAVLLPEVFLKALSIAQNLGHQVDGFTTANFDMIQHYRPLQNVVKRPTSGKGRGVTITGHHEINIPLLACAVLEQLTNRRG